MAKFQLWQRDEYGQGSILTTSENIQDVFKKAREMASDVNVNNSLTSSDRERNWDAYFPMIISEKKAKKLIYFYGGKGALNKPVFYSLDTTNNDIKEVEYADIPQVSTKIYLGNISTRNKEEKDWYAADYKGKEITDLSHPDLINKTSFFIKVVK